MTEWRGVEAEAEAHTYAWPDGPQPADTLPDLLRRAVAHGVRLCWEDARVGRMEVAIRIERGEVEA